jgi:hypothetical protein
MSKIDKIKFFIWIFIIIDFILAGFISFFRGDQLAMIISVFGILMAFMPMIIERRFKIDFSSGFEIIVLLFIFASFFLGEFQSFYTYFWWWDLLLHGFSGLALSLLAFSLVYLLNKKNKIDLSPLFVSIFAFSFAMAIAGLWEMVEFSIDSFFGLNMQKSGLSDTMWDLIITFFMALITSVVGFVYMRKNKLLFFRWVRNFFIVSG